MDICMMYCNCVLWRIRVAIIAFHICVPISPRHRSRSQRRWVVTLTVEHSLIIAYLTPVGMATVRRCMDCKTIVLSTRMKVISKGMTETSADRKNPEKWASNIVEPIARA